MTFNNTGDNTMTNFNAQPLPLGVALDNQAVDIVTFYENIDKANFYSILQNKETKQ